MFYRSAAAQQVRKEGRAEVWAQAVLMVLERRGLEVPDGVRERVLSCRDSEELGVVLDRAWEVTEVTRAQDLFGD
ncbi:hypothetical protein AQJ91_02570 [Streptomyces dysideae]|uniref:Uncharacterized protein n=1 Tax=Streptomyces dysideae TaxID=909626 RepID=A0A101V585_9ACTN|nr:hypothetical protein AQJ91_02570 [Streptomyces dysideae]